MMRTEEEQCMQLVKFDVPVAHYLETRKFYWHSIHILCSAQTLVLLVVLPAKKRKTYVNFHCSIKIMFTCK
jgi:hypothetical protein